MVVPLPFSAVSAPVIPQTVQLSQRGTVFPCSPVRNERYRADNEDSAQEPRSWDFWWHIDSAFLFMSFPLLNQNYLLCPHRSSPVSLRWLLQISAFPFYPPFTKKNLDTYILHTDTHTQWSYFCALLRGEKNPLKSLIYTTVYSWCCTFYGFWQNVQWYISTIIKVSYRITSLP